MAITHIGMGYNANAGSGTSLFCTTALFSGTALVDGDAILVGGGWVGGDTAITWSDDQGGVYLPLATFAHPTADLRLQLALLFNATASPERLIQMECAAARTARACNALHIRGARTTTSPLVASGTGSGTSATSATAANVNPGGAGAVYSMMYSASGAEPQVQGATFTLAGGDDHLFSQYKLGLGAGNVAASQSLTGATNLIIVSVALRDTTSGSTLITFSGGGQIVQVS